MKLLAEKFLKLMGKDKLLIFQSDFLPLLVISNWMSYYDPQGKLINFTPFILVRKGRMSKAWISDTKYIRASKETIKRILDESYDFDFIKKRYAKVKADNEKMYEQYYISQQKNKLQELKNIYNLLVELVRATIFIERVDKKILEEIISELKLKVDFNKVWEASQILNFKTFETAHNEEIISGYNNPERLQHIFTNYTHVPFRNEVKKELQKINLKEIKIEIAKSKKKIAENNKKLKEIEKNLSVEEKKLLNCLHWLMFARDDRKVVISKNHALIFNLVADLFEEWGIDKNLVKYPIIQEVFKGKEFVLNNLKRIEARKNNYVILYESDLQVEQSEKDIDLNLALLEERTILETDYQNNEIHGEIGSKGKAVGKVKIILHQGDFSKFKTGEILVTGMTRPEFVPLMKKASAIITDEGGITCHAAIMSRELGLPAIIGTKIATKVLKDGMCIEVDADKGVVKIIKK